MINLYTLNKHVRLSQTPTGKTYEKEGEERTRRGNSGEEQGLGQQGVRIIYQNHTVHATWSFWQQQWDLTPSDNQYKLLNKFLNEIMKRKYPTTYMAFVPIDSAPALPCSQKALLGDPGTAGVLKSQRE